MTYISPGASPRDHRDTQISLKGNGLVIYLASKKSEIQATTYSGQRGEACQEDPEPYYTSADYLNLVLCLFIHFDKYFFVVLKGCRAGTCGSRCCIRRIGSSRSRHRFRASVPTRTVSYPSGQSRQEMKCAGLRTPRNSFRSKSRDGIFRSLRKRCHSFFIPTGL